MGTTNDGFYWMKEQGGLNRGITLTLDFFSASAGWVAIGLLTDVYSRNPK
jgi:hypothetical protein